MRKKVLGLANQGTALFELQQQVEALQDNLPKMSIWVYGEIDARLDALEANEPQIDPTAAIDTAFDAADTIEQQAREIAQLKGQIADMHKRCDCNNSPFSNWNL